MKKTLLAILIILAALAGFSQNLPQPRSPKGNVKIHIPRPKPTPKGQPQVVFARIEGNDTILIVYLPEVDIDMMNRYYEITETRQGRRLVNNVRKVYPYAKLAADKLHEYDTLLAYAGSDNERRRMMKQAEQEITDQYSEELKHLTFSQGAILIRLLDRETGNTSYQLVQELRGNIRAFFYQGFARLWGYDLKTEYNPKSNPEDEQIEVIATLLERGQI